jgi:NADPH-dependent 7-cyano-7-deazaguanine reductase QueF
MLETLPNREPEVNTVIRLRTPYGAACPVSGYPLEGSYIDVQYTPAACILGLDSVARHLPTYADQARDVETVAQLLTRDCSAALGVPVIVSACYVLRDGIELWATCQS